MVYEFLSNGFEEIEALGPVDILRRGGVEVKTVSVTGSEYVETSHGITIKTDVKFEDCDFADAQLLMLPGGLPGATNLNAHEGLRQLLSRHAEKGTLIAAICAAPLVLGSLGLLKGKRATCYPGFEKYMDGATYTEELFTIDGNIITGRGPAATFPYAYAILALLTDEATAKSIADGMIYTQLISD